MYSLLYVFTSQYTNKVDFISMGETEIGDQRDQSQTGAKVPRCPLERPLQLRLFGLLPRLGADAGYDD